MYIKTQDFKNILKHYPNEWAHIQYCVEEFSPSLEVMVNDYVAKHQNVCHFLFLRVIKAFKAKVKYNLTWNVCLQSIELKFCINVYFG